MLALEKVYRCLLADVANHTGFSEIRGSCFLLQWCINDAPKLEKLVLETIETGESLNLELFPDSLRRLAAGSVSDPYKLRFLRQLLLFSYKAHVQHTASTTAASLHQFVATNASVGDWAGCLGSRSPVLLKEASRQVQSVLYKFREKEVIPFHGPGSSTTPKWKMDTWYPEIDVLYPYSDYFSLYGNRDHCSRLTSLNEGCIEAKVIPVPKDSRGPRIICVHPAEAIWIQQGIRVELERAISLSRSAIGPWPRGRVRFDDQSLNGKIALNSSKSRIYATLDLKEASDRLSDPLVQVLFGRKYKWFGCCRAQKYRIQQGLPAPIVGDLHCYAPMGNATTFPVQSLAFWAICCASLRRQGFISPGAVFVVGDDIAVPTVCAEGVINDLESFGLLVNRTKSFWRGGFRESCGVDAFNGIDVTPVRWKTTIDADGLTGLQSLSDIAQRLRRAGYWEASVTAYSILRERMRRLGKDLPLVGDPNHGGIAEFSSNEYYCWRDAYWNRDIQWYASPIWRLQGLGAKGPHYGWNHVLESVCSLERTGRSNVPDRGLSRDQVLKRGWMPIP